jgi:hypothetical protein
VKSPAVYQFIELIAQMWMTYSGLNLNDFYLSLGRQERYRFS